MKCPERVEYPLFRRSEGALPGFRVHGRDDVGVGAQAIGGQGKDQDALLARQSNQWKDMTSFR